MRGRGVCVCVCERQDVCVTRECMRGGGVCERDRIIMCV